MSSPQTTSEVAAVADAIRSHDRFLLITHENPDGDALGSILAMKLALDRLGKDGVMYLYGEAPLPAEDRVMEPRHPPPGLPDGSGEPGPGPPARANQTPPGTHPWPPPRG